MLSKKGSVYTDLLVREICAHLEWMATDASRTACESTAFHRAARSIGRHKNEFVSRTMRQIEWHRLVRTAGGKEAERGR